MSETGATANQWAEPGREEMLSALFGQLVMQQANMALMLLGKVAHPETGQVTKDVDAARLFIDELEMLEVKTKGNLSKDEEALLKQSLMSLRLAFVEAVESPAAEQQPQPKPQAPSSEPAPSVAPGATASEDEHRKKFSKKY